MDYRKIGPYILALRSVRIDGVGTHNPKPQTLTGGIDGPPTTRPLHPGWMVWGHKPLSPEP